VRWRVEETTVALVCPGTKLGAPSMARQHRGMGGKARTFARSVSRPIGPSKKAQTQISPEGFDPRGRFRPIDKEK
jgi:hypothetical protein